MLGGHWLALQSLAWTRMLVEFSRQNSVSTAISNTFDGKHPCRICLQIRQERRQEERKRKEPLLARIEKMPDLILDGRQPFLPSAGREVRDALPAAPRSHADFIESPPTPPPRGSLAVL